MQIPKPRNQFLYRLAGAQAEVWIKRLDELDTAGTGNKWFKLKYNLKEARQLGINTILTFGGAYSNHIAATAYWGKKMGFDTIGVIRGEELGRDLTKTLRENATLRGAFDKGMRFYFVSRKQYRYKETPEFLKELQLRFGQVYIVPEGGTNALAVKGCEGILTHQDEVFDLICCAVGTGGTISGIVNASWNHQKICGFSALQADLSKTVRAYTKKQNWELFKEDEFGGFAKINTELVSFMNRFAREYSLPLDPLYTGKMMFALKQKLAQHKELPYRRILVIHSGGLQGISGINRRLRKKKLPILEYM